jgi:hypothetical protein
MKVYIVFLQRYPSDTPVQRHFTNRNEAENLLTAKLEDYRYTSGQAWMKTYHCEEVK